MAQPLSKSTEACSPCGDGSQNQPCCTTGTKSPPCSSGYVCGGANSNTCVKSSGGFHQPCSTVAGNKVPCDPTLPGLSCTSLGAPPDREWCDCVVADNSTGKACGEKGVCFGTPKPAAPTPKTPKASPSSKSPSSNNNCSFAKPDPAVPTAAASCQHAKSHCPPKNTNFCINRDPNTKLFTGCADAIDNQCNPANQDTCLCVT